MSKFFSGFPSWLRFRRSAPDKAVVEVEMPIAELPTGVFPILPPGELLLRFRASVSRIEELAGTTPLHFQRYYLDTLHRFARWCQQRPASQPHYARPSGLLDRDRRRRVENPPGVFAAAWCSSRGSRFEEGSLDVCRLHLGAAP